MPTREHAYADTYFAIDLNDDGVTDAAPRQGGEVAGAYVQWVDATGDGRADGVLVTDDHGAVLNTTHNRETVARLTAQAQASGSAAAVPWKALGLAAAAIGGLWLLLRGR